MMATLRFDQALRARRGVERSAICGLGSPAELSVDPAVAQGFVKRLVVGKAGRRCCGLFRQDEPHPGRLPVMILEPLAPCEGIGNGQFEKLVGHLHSLAVNRLVWHRWVERSAKASCGHARSTRRRG